VRCYSFKLSHSLRMKSVVLTCHHRQGADAQPHTTRIYNPHVGKNRYSRRGARWTACFKKAGRLLLWAGWLRGSGVLWPEQRGFRGGLLFVGVEGAHIAGYACPVDLTHGVFWRV
jgi:hypothetical protein